jgi:8-oxo-dGTP pyrophosphatase MutT (NUDIX family)
MTEPPILDRLKKTSSEHVLLLLKRLPDLFLVVALGAIVANDLVKKFFDFTFFDSAAVFVKLAAPIILALAAVLVRLLLEIKNDVKVLHNPHSDTVTVLPGENSVPCAELLSSRSQIDILTLAGGVIVPLDQDNVKNAIRDSRRLSRVRCLVANPFSAAIVCRYAQDEPTWKERGTDAIETRLIWLFNLIETMEAPAEKLSVRVYDSYPMLSLFRADRDVYASYYAYRLRGNDTPMVLTNTETYFGRSVLKHFEKLYEESPSLAQWMVEHYGKLRRPAECRFGVRYSGVFLEAPDGAVILQKRDSGINIANPGQLSVFGGRANGAESALGTVLRELREETGLRPQPADISLIAALPYLENELTQRCMLCTYFLLRNVPPDTLNVVEGGLERMTVQEALSRDDLTELPRRILQIRATNDAWPTTETLAPAKQ